MNIDYIRAVKALSSAPSPCCGAPRVPFLFMGVDSDVHYACLNCEASSLHVDPKGRHHGRLRQACDPAWCWVPSAQRAVMARYGTLGTSEVTRNAPPILRFDVFEDVIWAGDRAMLLRLDLEAEYLRRVTLGASKALVQAHVADGLVRSIMVRDGHKRLDLFDLMRLTVIEDRLPLQSVLLVAELYPDVSWWWLSASAPVLAYVGNRPVAAVMPCAETQKAKEAA